MYVFKEQIIKFPKYRIETKLGKTLDMINSISGLNILQ